MTEPALHIRRAGPEDGPPVVLVHGAWHAGWFWEHDLIPALAGQGMRVIAPDLRGHGQSAPGAPLWRTRIADYAGDIAQVIDGRGRPPVLIGHSMGGFICQHLVARGVAVRGVGLLASVPAQGAIRAALRILRRAPLSLLSVTPRLSMRPLVDTPDKARAMFLTPDASDDAATRLAERLGDESYLAFLDMIALDLPGKPAAGLPACVIAGGADALFSVAEQARLAHRFGTTPHVMPGAPHDVLLSDEGAQAVRVLTDWVLGLP